MTPTTRVQLLNRHRHPDLFEQVHALGQRHKKTLGFLPRGGFEEHADKGGILIHLSPQQQVNGYVLYRRSGTPQQIWIVHLCVDHHARRQGVASHLIQHLTQHTRHARGIGLHCRADYDATHMWPLLDFRPVSRKPGRGKDEAELIFWWRDHGHPTLFTPDAEYLEAATLRAVLDANVVYDLIDDRRPYHDEATGLLAPWLRAVVEYSVSPELHLEIMRQGDPDVRRRSQHAASTFLQLPVNTDELKTLAATIRNRLGWADTDNNRGDAHHLAYTALSHCRYFITRDDTILDAATRLEEDYGIVVMLPRELAMQSHELQQADQYRPLHVGDTQFRTRRLGPDDAQQLYATFRHDQNAELKKDFEQRVAARLAHPDQHHNALYEDTTGRPLLFTSTGALPDQLQLEFFRTVKHPLTPKLARYALHRLITRAAREGRWVVTCRDPQRDEAARAALGAARFLPVPKHDQVKIVPPLVGTAEEVAASLREHAWSSDELRAHAEQLALSVKAADEQPLEWLPQIEQVLWPAKILHAQLGNYLVPIRPTWARKLFDEGIAGLYSDRQHERLLLNWENVYYSKAKRQQLMRPGSHIVWYVSSESGYNVRALRACSTVEEVAVGTARDLHARFKHLGVYRLRDLQDMEGDESGLLLAFRFSRTELFPHPIKLDAYRQVRASLGLGGPAVYGPTRMSNEEFSTLYSLGHGRP